MDHTRLTKIETTRINILTPTGITAIEIFEMIFLINTKTIIIITKLIIIEDKKILKFKEVEILAIIIDHLEIFLNHHIEIFSRFEIDHI